MRSTYEAAIGSFKQRQMSLQIPIYTRMTTLLDYITAFRWLQHSMNFSLDVSVEIAKMKSTLVYALACSTGLYALYKLCDALLRLPRVGRYSDRYILVTGCGSGFGLALVKRLDSLGCHVFAGCRTQDSAAQLAKSCSDRVLPIQMDVSKPDSVRKALEIVSNKLTEDGKGLRTPKFSFLISVRPSATHPISVTVSNQSND